MLGVSVGEIALLVAAVMVAGVATGILAGLFGIGGGAIIVPVLYEIFRILGVPEEPESAALSHDGSLLAVAAADGITLLSIPTFEKSHRLNDAFLSCLFVGEKLFWTCARFTEQTVILEVWEPGSWAKIARAKIADPYGNSSFSLFPHPNRNSVVVWAAEVRMVNVSSGLPSTAPRSA